MDKPQTPPASRTTLGTLDRSAGRRAVTLTANAGAAEFEISREVEFSLSQSGGHAREINQTEAVSDPPMIHPVFWARPGGKFRLPMIWITCWLLSGDEQVAIENQVG